ncbi:MAG: beta strand repeat-containing protein, partial [Bacteroidota bacterium]
PAGAGGFELGGDFASNGWTVTNGTAVAQWNVGTVPTLFSSKSAYVSDNGGSAHSYSLATTGSLVHFYRDVTFPAGESQIAMSFNWYCAGESTYDFMQVSIGSTSIVPVPSGSVSGSNALTTPVIPGTTVIGGYNLQGTAVQTVNTTVPASIVGNCSAPVTLRLFFTWRHDGSAFNNPPAAVDNISLVSSTPAAPLSGTYSVGPTGAYTTLTAAVNDVNTKGVSGPVILELQSAYTGAGEVYPIVLAGQVSCNPLSSTNTATIRPESGSGPLTITGSGATAFIDINGGKWWRIDGRPGGTGTSKNLTILNTSTAASSLRFINEGSNNIIRYCNLRGVATSTVSGVVVFSTTSGSGGNDNNLIEFCDIFDGATNPVNGIYSSATTTTSSQYNDNNVITNNNFYNMFSASSGSNGVNLASGNTGWTISNNSFYQTVSRAPTGGTHTAVLSSSSLNQGLSVTGNFIGGTAPMAGGTPLTYTGAGIFRFVQFTVGTVSTSTISGNTFQNISVTSSSTSPSQSLVSLLTGRINCINNTIGNQTGVNNIVFSLSGSAARLQAVVAGTGTPELTTISGNNIGSMSLVVTGAPATVPAFFPISVQGTTTGHNFTVSNNIIGSPTVANSISSNANSTLCGIISFSGAAGQIYNGNTIANLNNTSTGTSASAYGMNLQGSGTSPALLGTFTANQNTIFNIGTSSGATTIISALGLVASGTGQVSGSNTFSQNTVHSISNTNTTAATIAAGVLFSLSSTTVNLVERNLVHSISLGTSGSGSITGIQINSGTGIYRNNMVRVGVDAAGNSVTGNYIVTALAEASAAVPFILHNSLYVGGSGVTGTSNSFALRSLATSTTSRVYRNNACFNARSNGTGTGKHYAITLAGTAAYPAGTQSDNNLLFTNGTGGVLGLFNSTDQTTLAAWRAASGNDWASVNGDPVFVNPGGNASTVDLHIQTGVQTFVESLGAVLPDVSNDFDGQTRSSLTPTDIGADAGNFVPVTTDVFAPSISYVSLPATYCGTSEVVLSGVSITDLSGVPTSGTLVPRVYFRKGAGAWASQPGTLSSGTGTSGIWSFTMPAADMGGLSSGDVVSYYIIAQDVVTPTPNIGSYIGGAVATDVNTVTSHPVNALTTTVRAFISGVYNVGSGGNYATLTAAAADYNVGCLNGPVTFQLTDPLYTSPAETFPIQLNAIQTSSAINTLTIKPSVAGVVVSGSVASGALLRLNGADYITVDGSTSGGSDKNLTFTNSATTAPAGIWLSSLGNNAGSTNNTLKNLTVNVNSATSATACGISVSGATILSSGADNDNNSILDNAVNSTNIGIYANGLTGGLVDNLTVSGNSIFTNSTLSPVYGVEIANVLGANVSRNSFD